MLTERERAFCLRLAARNDPIRAYLETIDESGAGLDRAEWPELAALLARDDIQEEIAFNKSWLYASDGAPTHIEAILRESNVGQLLRNRLLSSKTRSEVLEWFDLARIALFDKLAETMSKPFTASLALSARRSRFGGSMLALANYLQAADRGEWAAEVRNWAAMILDLNEGIQDDLFLVSRPPGKPGDSTGLWLMRCQVCLAMKVLMKAGYRKKKAAAHYIAASADLAHLRQSAASVQDAVAAWFTAFSKSEVRSVAAMETFEFASEALEVRVASMSKEEMIEFANTLLSRRSDAVAVLWPRGRQELNRELVRVLNDYLVAVRERDKPRAELLRCMLS